MLDEEKTVAGGVLVSRETVVRLIGDLLEDIGEVDPLDEDVHWAISVYMSREHAYVGVSHGPLCTSAAQEARLQAASNAHSYEATRWELHEAYESLVNSLGDLMQKHLAPDEIQDVLNDARDAIQDDDSLAAVEHRDVWAEMYRTAVLTTEITAEEFTGMEDEDAKLHGDMLYRVIRTSREQSERGENPKDVALAFVQAVGAVELFDQFDSMIHALNDMLTRDQGDFDADDINRQLEDAAQEDLESLNGKG